MELKIEGRILSKETQSSWGIGALKFGVTEESLGINENGYLINLKRTCKFKFDNFYFFGRKHYQVINR